MYNLLKHTATIQSKATSQTQIGTFVSVYSTRATIECLVQPKTLTEQKEFGKVTKRTVYKMYCMPTTISESDRVVWDGNTYEITGIGDAAGQSHHMEVDMERFE